MQDRSTRRSTPRELLPAGGRSRPSTHSVLALATLLTALVIGVVPAVALHADVHPIVVLGVALGAYGLLAVATGEVVSGAVASIPVLATVNADVPLWEGPNHTVELAVVLADVGVLAGAGIVAVELLGRRGERALAPFDAAPLGPLGDRTRELLGWPAALLAAFALWALLGAAFAAHDARTAAVFGVSQLRYVAYFAVAAGLVATGFARVRSLAGAYVVAVLGHAGFALAQFHNGDSFGVSVLGETDRIVDHTIVFFGDEMVIGRYLGGLAGNNAAFASLAIPAAAVLVWVAVGRGSWERGLPVRLGASLAVVPLAALCTRFSQYDSATVGFVATVGGTVLFASIPHWPDDAQRRVHEERSTALATVGVGVAGVVVAALAAGPVPLFDALPVVSSQNLETRLHDYGTAFDLALERPMFGYGGGNVETVATELGFSDDVAIHSILLSFLAETGFVGAGLWTGAVVATGARAVEATWSEHEDAALVGVLCIGALGLLTIAMIDQIWDNHTSMGAFWLFGGAIAGLEYGLDSDGHGLDSDGRRPAADEQRLDSDEHGLDSDGRRPAADEQRLDSDERWLGSIER